MKQLNIKHKILLSCATFVITLLGISFLGTPKTSAAVPPGVAPPGVIATINLRCGPAYNWNIVQLQWISPNGSPTATSTTVVAGSAAVALQLNWITYRCKSSTHLSGSSQIVSTNPSIAALNGLVTDFPYHPTPGNHRSGVARTFNYPGPFNSTRDITLRLTSRGTVTYSNGNDFCAVVNIEPRVPTTAPHNFTPQPGYCVQSTNNFTIRINVAADVGTCSISLSTATPAPGATFTATFTVRNTGTYANWPTAGRPPIAVPNPNRYQLGSGINNVASPYDNNIFQQTPAQPQNNRVELPGQPSGFGPLIFPGQSYTFSQNFVAPAAIGNYTFGWRLLQRGVKNFTNAGSHCSRAITIGTPFTMTCGTLTPRTVEVGEQFAMNLEYNNDSGVGGPTVNYTDYRMSVTGPEAYSNADLPFTAAPPGGSGSGTAPPVPGTISISAPGSYEALMIMYNRNGTASTADDTEVLRCDKTDDDFEITSATHPYFSVRGSDIEVGRSASCDGWINGGGGTLTAWNAFSGGDDPSMGAGTNLAVFALDVIDGVASAQGTAYGTPTATGLTFANYPTSTYGGKYPASSCPADYFARSGRTGTPLPIILGTAVRAPSTDSTSYQTGNRVLNPTAFGVTSTTVNAGNKVTIYVSGNVRIVNNIYATPAAPGNAVSDLARFELIVEGNIYIHPQVTQLDGLYVAQPDSSGVGGKIYTCAATAGFAQPSLAQLQSNNAIDGCQRTLTVNGAMIANELKLYRSNGSVRSGVAGVAGVAAEIFNYVPSMWLSENGSGIGISEINGSYDSITSLPPVL